VPDEPRFRRSTYLGGLPSAPDAIHTKELVFGEQSIHFDYFESAWVEGYGEQRVRRQIEVCATSDIGSIEVTSEQVAKSRVRFALAFGILGAAGAKATQDRATVIVHTKAGELGYLVIDRQAQPEVQAALAPWLRSHGIALGAPQVNSASALSIADELKKLGELRDAGLLTDEEFAAQKGKLLNS
jgi:hypothetical protein